MVQNFWIQSYFWAWWNKPGLLPQQDTHIWNTRNLEAVFCLYSNKSYHYISSSIHGSLVCFSCEHSEEPISTNNIWQTQRGWDLTSLCWEIFSSFVFPLSYCLCMFLVLFHSSTSLLFHLHIWNSLQVHIFGCEPSSLISLPSAPLRQHTLSTVIR